MASYRLIIVSLLNTSCASAEIWKPQMSSEWVAGGKSENFQCLDLQQPSDGIHIWTSKELGHKLLTRGHQSGSLARVRIDPLFQAPAPAHVRCASVTFEPGARTAWHTHPLGQTLIVTAGCGWVQHDGGPVDEIPSG